MDAQTAKLLGRIADLEDQLLAARTATASTTVADVCPFPERPDTVERFAVEVLRPMLTDRTGARVTKPAPWCDQWQAHPWAAHLIGVAWVSWPDPTTDGWAEGHRLWACNVAPLVLDQLAAVLAPCTSGHRSQTTTTNGVMIQ